MALNHFLMEMEQHLSLLIVRCGIRGSVRNSDSLLSLKQKPEKLSVPISQFVSRQNMKKVMSFVFSFIMAYSQNTRDSKAVFYCDSLSCFVLYTPSISSFDSLAERTFVSIPIHEIRADLTPLHHVSKQKLRFQSQHR